jgi:hypothetical protein
MPVLEVPNDRRECGHVATDDVPPSDLIHGGLVEEGDEGNETQFEP